MCCMNAVFTSNAIIIIILYIIKFPHIYDTLGKDYNFKLFSLILDFSHINVLLSTILILHIHLRLFPIKNVFPSYHFLVNFWNFSFLEGGNFLSCWLQWQLFTIYFAQKILILHFLFPLFTLPFASPPPRRHTSTCIGIFLQHQLPVALIRTVLSIHPYIHYFLSPFHCTTTRRRGKNKIG